MCNYTFWREVGVSEAEAARPARVTPENGGGFLNHAAKVLLILFLNHGAATFDAWSTRYVSSRFPGGCEVNPLQRPFVNSKALYFTSQIDASLADIALLRKWRNRKVRIAGAFYGGAILSGHLYAGAHNLNLAAKLSVAGTRKVALGDVAAELQPRNTFLGETICGGVRPCHAR